MNNVLTCIQLINISNKTPTEIDNSFHSFESLKHYTIYKYFNFISTNVFVVANDSTMFVIFDNNEYNGHSYLTNSKYYIGQGKVYNNYQSGLDYVWKDLFNYIVKHTHNRKLVISGYKNGAALAAICSYRLKKLLLNNDVELYVFNCPIVGDKKWVKHFDVVAYRYSTAKDTNIFNSTIFTTQIGTELFFDYNNKLITNPSILQKIISKLLNKDKFSDEKLYLKKINEFLLHSN